VNTTLPFEVISNEKKQEGKIQAGLKRVEVFASAEKASDVLAAIKEKGFEDTQYDSKGSGEQQQKVTTGRGMGEAQLAYSTRRTIVTIVDSDKLEKIVNAVKSAIGGGLIAISPMDALIHV